MGQSINLHEWLRRQCADFVFLPAEVFVEQGDPDWSLIARDGGTDGQAEAGHLVSLPKESAAPANVIEVALVDFRWTDWKT